MRFNFQARTKTGEIQTGIVEASSKEAAIELLKSHNLFVTSLKEAVTPFYAREIRIFKKSSRREIVALSRQIAIMFKSEIPLIEIFITLAKQTTNPYLKEKILGIIERVEGGMPLSKAFSFYPEIFNRFYIAMVKSGEAAGKLSEVFNYLADHLEKEYYFYRKITGAMIYPAIVLFVFFIVIFLIFSIVLPNVSAFVTETGQQMPLITQVLINFSIFIKKNILILILSFFLLIALFIYYIRTKEGREVFDKYILRIPLIGGLLRKIYLSRFAFNLSTLISAGLPISQALEITGEIVGNEIYKKIIFQTNEGVKRGESISFLLQRYSLDITPLFIQMIAVGERTGHLDTALINIANFYQNEVDRVIENLANILEPILIVFLAIVVGGLMASVILPLYQVIIKSF